MPQYVGINLLIEGSHIKRPRPHPHKTSNLVESHSATIASKHRSTGKENETSAEKSRLPPKRCMKTVVQQLTFSDIKPASERIVQPGETWRPQRSIIGPEVAQLSPRMPVCSLELSPRKPLHCGLANVRPRSGRAQASKKRHHGPVLSLGLISFQEPEPHHLVSSSMVPYSGVDFQRFSRHHNHRTIQASYTGKLTHKI